MKNNGTVLIYAIRRTDEWWREVGNNLGYERVTLVSDVKNTGDYNIVDDFYIAYKELVQQTTLSSIFFDEEEVIDIIARCRLLRWLPEGKARAMVYAMAIVFDRVLEVERPLAIICFPIDRYVSDVLERLGSKRGIPLYELTASLLPDMSMLMYRGKLIKFRKNIDQKIIETKAQEISNIAFTPSYVQRKNTYNSLRFVKIFLYFRLRGWAFKTISLLKNDLLNLHYLDSQSFLGHKPRFRDIRVTRLIDFDWRVKINQFDKDKRIFFGLQVFPEASIDYWIKDIELIKYEELLIRTAKAFSKEGFQILVKDHPLQYGFRQVSLLEDLIKIPNVVIVPYEVSGNAILELVGVNFTCTGTLGMQAALMGLKSVTVCNYYSNDEDFITFNSINEINDLPRRVEKKKFVNSLRKRQNRIVNHVLEGSFESVFFTFKDFNKKNCNPLISTLGKKLGLIIKRLLG
jgi:hypothetical protein